MRMRAGVSNVKKAALFPSHSTSCVAPRYYMIYEYSEYDLVISCRASQAISTRPKVSIFGFARMPARIVENEHCDITMLKNSIAFCLIDRPSFPHSSSHRHLFRQSIEYFGEYLRIQIITMLRVHRLQRRRVQQTTVGQGRAGQRQEGLAMSSVLNRK